MWIYIRTAHLAVCVSINTIAKPKDQGYQTAVEKWDKNLQPFKRHATEGMGMLVKWELCDY